MLFAVNSYFFGSVGLGVGLGGGGACLPVFDTFLVFPLELPSLIGLGFGDILCAIF